MDIFLGWRFGGATFERNLAEQRSNKAINNKGKGRRARVSREKKGWNVVQERFFSPYKTGDK